jgi:predicted dehydrogenase
MASLTGIVAHANKVRVAVIGLGDTGIIHANAYMNNSVAEVAAVCDVSEDSISRFIYGPWKWASWLAEESASPRFTKPEYGIRKTSTDYLEVAEDPDIDAVSICLPDVYHSLVAKPMLKNGKHVLLEKPMAPTVGECEEMIELSKKSQVKLMVAHMWRFHPEIRFMKKIVDSGEIGRVVKTKGYAVYVRGAPSGWYLQKKYAVRGPLLNVGIHAVDTVRFLLGEPKAEKVCANVRTVYGSYDVDDCAVMVIEFAGGTVSIIETGQNHSYADGVEASTQLFGTKGYARVFPTELHHRVGDIWGVFQPDIKVPHINYGMFQAEVDHFIECIVNDEDPEISGETAMEDVKIIESAYKSSRTGQVVEMRD